MMNAIKAVVIGTLIGRLGDFYDSDYSSKLFEIMSTCSFNYVFVGTCFFPQNNTLLM